ncbi:unnamed protein product [Clonostachys rosea f. rosea IK726]|uniref:Phytanoyl-CoA dioxygenase family protein n=2 Tax=Bionectria ochroleuca TaxID=29856 RepID=A0A0B7K369_BIOOC|nr:unnamed protein product [Clonostachys rosea f. rosea IK726]
MATPEIKNVIDSKTFKVLTPEQIESFMKFGYLRLPGAIPIENCDRWTEHVWERLGMDPDDKSTWHTERNHMAKLDVVPAKEIAPLAWEAICELCGGEDRIAKGGEMWTNGFIVNLGSKEIEGKTTPPKDLELWHVDGDFFVHFLDSPEQALLVIPCWTDVESNGGATWICDQGPRRIGKHLFEHPEGLSPVMQGRDEPYKPYASYDHCVSVIRDCPDESFHEMTGKKGDVILMHPLTLHSVSRNGRRLKRIISNPPVSLAAPFQFNRANKADHSLIELKTIQDVGGGFEKFRDWKITGAREKFAPLTVPDKEKARDREVQRLLDLGIALGEPISQMPHSMVYSS